MRFKNVLIDQVALTCRADLSLFKKSARAAALAGFFHALAAADCSVEEANARANGSVATSLLPSVSSAADSFGAGLWRFLRYLPPKTSVLPSSSAAASICAASSSAVATAAFAVSNASCSRGSATSDASAASSLLSTLFICATSSVFASRGTAPPSPSADACSSDEMVAVDPRTGRRPPIVAAVSDASSSAYASCSSTVTSSASLAYA